MSEYRLLPMQQGLQNNALHTMGITVVVPPKTIVIPSGIVIVNARIPTDTIILMH